MKKVLGIAVALLATGCFSTSNFHTAETLKKGESSLGFGWGVTAIDKLEAVTPEGESTSTDSDDLPSLPNLIPDTMLRFGLGDNMDWGVKIFFIGAQLDFKYRLLHTGGLSVSVDPTVGYARPFMVIEQFNLALPLQVSYRVSPGFLIYGAAQGFYGNWRFPFNDSETGKEIEDRIATTGYGITVGAELGGDTWFVRPEYNITSQSIFDKDSDGKLNFDYSGGGIAFGFHFGRTGMTAEEM